MIIEPLSGALGAEIRDVSLAGLDEDAWQEIRRVFVEYSVIVFRDQALEPADLMRVGARFGEPCFYPFVTGLDGYPYIFEVVKEEDERTNFGVNSAALKHGGGRSAMHKKIAGMKVHDTETAEHYEAEHPVARTHPETARK